MPMLLGECRRGGDGGDDGSGGGDGGGGGGDGGRDDNGGGGGGGLEGDFEVRWPKQTGAGVAAARRSAHAPTRKAAAAWAGPEQWGDGGATDFPGALGGLMAGAYTRPPLSST